MRRQPYQDLQGAGADIVIPGGIDGDKDPRLQKAIDLHALEIRRHITMSEVHMVHMESKTTLVYVVH